jgi:hypothetical protein
VDDWHEMYWDTLRGSLRRVSMALADEGDATIQAELRNVTKDTHFQCDRNLG